MSPPLSPPLSSVAAPLHGRALPLSAQPWSSAAAKVRVWLEHRVCVCVGGVHLVRI